MQGGFSVRIADVIVGIFEFPAIFAYLKIISKNGAKFELSHFQITYESVGLVQMNFLRLLSSRAYQNVTFNCQKSIMWNDTRGTLKYAVRLMGANEVEWSPHSRYYKPQALVDKCQV